MKVEKIKFFYDNPNKAIEMGNKARTKAENVFSYDLIVILRFNDFC
mgnify:CR=1 FL=1